MLKIIISRKRSFILPFLALFFFVFGANAIHPYFHKNYVIESIIDRVHDASGGHHSGKESISGFASGDKHSSCPICDYLALSSVLKSAVHHFVFKPSPSQQADVIYRQSEHAAHPTALFIRGPPRTLFTTLQNIFLSFPRR